MEWCLFEALRDEERDMLARSATISIAMDERNDRLLVTYDASKNTRELWRPGADTEPWPNCR